LGGAQNGKILKRLFSDVFSDVTTMTSLKRRHYWFFKSSNLSWSVWKTTIWPNHATLCH